MSRNELIKNVDDSASLNIKAAKKGLEALGLEPTQKLIKHYLASDSVREFYLAIGDTETVDKMSETSGLNGLNLDKESIFQAADIIDTNGGVPTVREVHRYFGYGSFETISKYLREWKTKTGKSTTVIKRLNKLEVFKLLDQMHRGGEFIGTKSVCRRLNTTSNRTVRKMINEWEEVNKEL